jgi:hypothetical protein
MLAAQVVLWETRNMESNPMLEKAWRTKDEWARAAGDDIRRLSQNIHQWVVGHPPPGPVMEDGKQLGGLVAEVAGVRTS